MTFFETKTILPFEDNAFLDKTPLYIKVSTAKTNDELSFLQDNKEDIKTYKKQIAINVLKGPHYYYDNNIISQKDVDEKIKEIFPENKNNLLYHICDYGTGKITYAYFCGQNKLREQLNKNFKYRKTFKDFTNNLAKKDYYVDTIIIKDILVFRFYIFDANYFKEGVIQGFHETFRICFKGFESWGENREETYHFDLRYMCEKKDKNFDFYYKFKFYNASKTLKDILDVYPFLKNTGEFFNISYSKNDLSLEELIKVNSAYFSFRSFCIKLNSLYQTTKVFKNVPIEVKNDLLHKPRLKKKQKIDYTKTVYVNIKENFICFHLFCGTIEMERVYFTKDKCFKFGYNFVNKKWTSTKKEKMDILFVPSTKYYYNKKLTKEDLNKFIIRRYNYPLFTPPLNIEPYLCRHKYPLRLVFLEMHIPLIESAYKLGFYNFVEDYMKNNLYLFGLLNQYIKKKTKKEISLVTMKNFHLQDFFNISGKKLKFIRKDVDWKTALEIRQKYENKNLIKFFPDDVMRLKIAQFCIDNAKIYKIVKLFINNNKDYFPFFKALLKRENPERLIMLYLDYLTFIPLANQYGAFTYDIFIKPSEIEFMHDKAYRDYSYQESLISQSTKVKKSLEDKFEEFVVSDEYKQFLEVEQEEDLIKLKNTNTNYFIMGPKTPNDLIVEGKELSHCVGGYRKRMANKKSYIYFCRDIKNPQIPLFTLEVNRRKIVSCKEKSNKKVYEYYLNQCYGYKDSINKSSEMKTHIEKWCKKNHINIHCKL